MRLSANARNFGFFQYWQGLTITQVDVEPKRDFVIGLSRKGNARSAVYFGSLPPGRYRPVKFSSEQCGAMCVSSTITINESFGEFAVESGRTTDLGHVVYEEVGYKKVMMVRGASLSNWIPSYVQEHYPNIPTVAVGAPYQGWQDDSAITRSLKIAYDRVRLTSNGLLRPTEASDGSLLFGSLLGMVKQWQPGKPMRYYDTGMQGAVESVVEVKPGFWLAGGESGRIRLSRDSGATWSDFGSGFPFQNIAGLHVYGERILATVSNSEALSIYETSLEQSAWQKLSSHELEFKFWTGVPIFPESFVVGGNLVTSLPTNRLVVTNLDTREAKVRSFPGSIFRFAAGADGVLRCMCTKALFNNPWNSDDLGETWKPSEHNRYMWVPHFTDDQTGYAVLKGKFMKTSDGGVSWTTVADAPKYGTQLGHIEATGDLYATDGFSFTYRSTDGGISWEYR